MLCVTFSGITELLNPHAKPKHPWTYHWSRLSARAWRRGCQPPASMGIFPGDFDIVNSEEYL